MHDRHFILRFDDWFRILAWPLGIRPSNSGVDVGPEEIRAGAGIWFGATIPRRAITNARRLQSPRDVRVILTFSWGVHTNLHGTWIVNGSLDGLVALDVDPPATGRTLGIPIHVRRLILSLDDPDGLLRAIWRPS